MAQTQTLAGRRQQAEEEFNQFVELLALNRQIDIDRAMTTCVLLGRTIDDLEAAASTRRVELAEIEEYNAKADPALFEAATDKVKQAEAKVASIRAEIAKFDPELKAAMDEAAVARRQLEQLNRDRNDVSSRLAHVRLGKTRAQMKADRLARDEHMRTVGVRM
jgi:chromosome segregation ATPase